MAIDRKQLPESADVLQQMVLDLIAQLDATQASCEKTENLLRQLLAARSKGGSERLSEDQLALFEAEWKGQTRAGLEIARQLGRKGGRKRQMTDSKIKSAKKLLTQRRTPSGCGQQPRSLGSHTLSVDSGFRLLASPDSCFP